MKAAQTEESRQDRFIISGALHGVTESALEGLRAFEAMGGHLELIPEKQLVLIQYDGRCGAAAEAKMIAILQQAGAHCESHGVICHGKDHCEPLNLHVGPLAKDHPNRLAYVNKHLRRWLRLRHS